METFKNSTKTDTKDLLNFNPEKYSETLSDGVIEKNEELGQIRRKGLSNNQAIIYIT
jgi:U3 small nucleolar ribonucleoprotein component